MIVLNVRQPKCVRGVGGAREFDSVECGLKKRLETNGEENVHKRVKSLWIR
jgi:hypothetical protein